MPQLILVLSCAIVFGRSASGGFLSWDDTQHILLNPWLQPGHAGHFWLHEYFGLFVPVTYTAWSWLFALWPSPKAFHLLNVFLHSLNSCLVYELALKVLSSRAKDKVELLSLGRRTFALIAALFFALHPLQVETVAWISGGRDLMAATFGLAAMIAAWNSADRLFPSWAALVRRTCATILFVMGLLCKPGLAALPAALKWLSSHTERRGLKWPMVWIWLGLGALIGGVTLQVQKAAASHLPHFGIWQRLYVASDAVFFYLQKFFLPFALSADYGRTPEKVLTAGTSMTPPFAFVLVLAVALVAAWRFLPGAVRGGLGFFLIMLLPVLGLFPFSAQSISTVFDHYMYLPLAGLSFACAATVCEAKIRLEIRVLIALIIVAWWGFLSFNRVVVWNNDRTLFEDVLSRNPTSYNALVNLAIEDIKAHSFEAARLKLDTARLSEPRSAVAWANLTHVYWLERNPTKVFEIGEMLRNPTFIEYNKGEPQALSLIGRMYGRVLAEGKRAPEAREAFCFAIHANPYDHDLLDEFNAFLRGHPEQGPCQ